MTSFSHGKCQLVEGQGVGETKERQLTLTDHSTPSSSTPFFLLCLATTKHSPVAKADPQPLSSVPEIHLNDNATLVVKEEQPLELEMPCLQLLCCV